MSKPSPTELAREISMDMGKAMANPDDDMALYRLHQEAMLLAPQGVEKGGELMDGNKQYRDSVRQLLANVYSSAGGNGPEIGISKYGFITCDSPYNQVKVDGKDMYQVRRIIADPQAETKVLDIGNPFDPATIKVHKKP